MKNTIHAIAAALLLAILAPSCSNAYMEDMNTDKSKATFMDSNALLTTALLQTYGDFGLMDTYRSYVSGFTQHLAGGWNVTNYAGSVHPDNQQMSLLWDEFYNVGIKNLVDGIANTADKPNLNAALRIHLVYMMSILTDIYGDVPCTEAGKGYTDGISNPKYDTQKDIYDFFFTELAACEAQLSADADRITGDVTAYNGDPAKWQKLANALRLRFAMRISDVDPAKAQAEFEAALAKPYIQEAEDDAYVRYIDGPFTQYDGARDLDFRVNAYAEILYGQDKESPTLVCATLYNKLKNTADPRLYKICRHYNLAARNDKAYDVTGILDVTDEVAAWEVTSGLGSHPCRVGEAWYSSSCWVNAPDNADIPTLAAKVAENPDAGYDKNNFNARMVRPALSLDFEAPYTPGIILTSAEVEFLLAEAADKGWGVTGTAAAHYNAGVTAAMKLLNQHYLAAKNAITDEEIAAFLAANPLGANAKESINTQAWILHLTNPAEAWANLRRSDYPVLDDRRLIPKEGSFTYDDDNLETPVRLKYPKLEENYNNDRYTEAINRAPLNGKDNWHTRVWWDQHDGRFTDNP